MHVKRVWFYFIVFLKFHSTKSFLMLPWWRSCLGRSVQKERDLHFVAATSDISRGSDGDIQVERKRKAQQSLDQDAATANQECSCCRSVSTSNVINDVQTPAKRFCTQSTFDSNEFSTNPNAVTPQLHATVASQQNHQDSLSDAEIQELLWKEANYDSFGLDVTLKRSDYIVWDDFFMGMAKLSAMRSKDPQAPSTGGACIVDEENRVIGIGYNGFPQDCSDDVLPWWNNNDNTQATRPWLYTQSPYVCHAEVNAILNKCSPNVEGARLYVARFPCHDCAKVIIQSRIKEVVYMDDTDHDSDSCRASRIMFTMAGVTMRQYQPRQSSILLDFASVIPPGNHHTSNSNMKEETLARPQQGDGVIQYRDLIRIEAGYDPAITSTGKRMTGVLSWDDWFMAVAFLTAKRSKDPNTQVGACIVDGNKRIVGLGYNGFPRGCSDDYLPWARTASSNSPLHTKYLYVCHAEVNAILNKGSSDVKGATIYVALFPCNDCAKVIIQAGIREVVYLNDQYHGTDSCRASRIMFTMAGVQLREHVPNIPNLTITLNEEKGLTSTS